MFDRPGNVARTGWRGTSLTNMGSDCVDDGVQGGIVRRPWAVVGNEIGLQRHTKPDLVPRPASASSDAHIPATVLLDEAHLIVVTASREAGAWG